MKYYEDMRTKWGFDDGDSTPEFAELYREVYIEAINRVAKQLGSKVEAFPYDRPGMHNPCLLLYRKIGEDGLSGGEPQTDEPMDKALSLCLSLGLDALVEVSARRRKNWKAAVAELIANSVNP